MALYTLNTRDTWYSGVRNYQSCQIPHKSLYDGDICRIYIFYDGAGKYVTNCY